MQDNQYAILKKEDFNSLISTLSKLHKLAAPIFKGYNNYSFEEVRSGEEIALKYIPTILPPKKFFMPVHETLLEYDIGKGRNAEAVTEYEEMVLFGVHTCDMAGIQCLNMVFSEHPEDHNYLIHKQNIKIIGLECNEYCDEYANCCLMNTHIPHGGYDHFSPTWEIISSSTSIPWQAKRSSKALVFSRARKYLIWMIWHHFVKRKERYSRMNFL